MSEQLINGLILLGATAVVSGILAPYIVNRIQIANQRRLKVFEGDLARQSKIISDQEELIRTLASLLWEFQLKLIAPLYYGQGGFPKAKREHHTDIQGSSSANEYEPSSSPYEKAVSDYWDNAGRLLGLIRAEIGAAVRLVPEDLWVELRTLYYSSLLPLDLKVTRLILENRNQRNAQEWQEAHTYALQDFAGTLDATVNSLAARLRLKFE
jgi:hypothetical protein